MSWMGIAKGETDYRDPTPLPSIIHYDPKNIAPAGRLLAKAIREKQYSNDVRESIARWLEITMTIAQNTTDDTGNFEDEVNGRQNKVESDQKDLANQFARAVGALTADSEVVLSRDSKNFGGFGLLDGRLEFIEDMIAHQVPGGFEIEIQHNQGKHPSCQVQYYEYAIGSEPDGFGSGPDGTFGGINYKNINCGIDYIDNSRIKITLPVAFSLPNAKISYADQYWYLADGYKTIRVYLGGVDDGKATSGLTLSTVRSTITDGSTDAVSAKVANGEVTWTDGGGTSAT